MQTDLSTERVGAAIAGRLNGTAFQFTMQLTWSRLDRATLTQVVHVAPELLALPAEDAVFDPITGVQISPSELSGAQYLVSKLQSGFSPSAQDLQWQAMISFFDMYRDSQTYDEYQAMRDLAWHDVVSQSNFQMNEVGRTFFLLRGAQSLRGSSSTSVFVSTVISHGPKRSGHSWPACSLTRRRFVTRRPRP